MSAANPPPPDSKAKPASTLKPRPAPVAAQGKPAGENNDLVKLSRLKRLVTIQGWAIGILGVIFIAILPLVQPYYVYLARNQDKQQLKMIALDMPNMTDRAVIAWSVISITEIMTMGFGDMDAKLPTQRIRFTEEGWDAYTKAFVRQSIGETFKKNELVLTTVPSNTPVIVEQGLNENMIYQWIVQMPVIMTYATNNNVTQRDRRVVTLKIMRVPSSESSAGVAIDNVQIE